MSVKDEILAIQEKILNWQELITKNKYKDEIRTYKKFIRKAEDDIILLKCIEQDLQAIKQLNTQDFIDGVSGNPNK